MPFTPAPGVVPVVTPAQQDPAPSKAADAFTYFTNVIHDHEGVEARYRRAADAVQAAQDELRDASAARDASATKRDDAQTKYRDALDASNGGNT